MKRIMINGEEYNYLISKNGIVKNLKGKIMKPWIHKGYTMYALCKSGKYKKIGLHQLLATHFIENPNNYTLVRHLDDNRQNNNLNNLAWGTHQMNVDDYIRNQKIKRGKDRPHSKLTDFQVVAIYINEIAKTTTELSNIFGVSKGTISKIQNGKNWTHITNGLIAMFRPYKNGKGVYGVS